MDAESLVAQRKQELLNYVSNFYRKSWDWRSQKFHNKWDRFDRYYHSLYDPTLNARKKPWQSRMFVNLTVQNVELICSQIYKTLFGMKPAVKTEPGPAGDTLQAELISDAVDYEARKSQLDIHAYDALKEACRYGTGFVKLFWLKKEDTRRRRVPVEETPGEVIESAPMESLTGEAPMPSPRLKGFAMQDIPVLIQNHLGAQYVHIRDIFPEPNTTTWDKILHRDKIDYGTIVRHINRGEFFDVRGEIENAEESEKFDQDLQTIRHDRGYFEANRSMSKFEKKHTVWELWAPLPRKWIQFDIEEGDAAEELVPAKAMVVSGTALLSVQENIEYDGEHPFLRVDYIRTGETYGKGVCELIGDEQDYANEIVNQRLDNVNLILNKGIAVIESALVNAEKDLEVEPGWQLRFKQTMDDVKKVFAPIEFQDVTASAYRETLEIERRIQETTGANRVTLGSSGLVKDTNQTLGGMELLRQMFNERVAAYGLIIESQFLVVAACKIYGLIYQNRTPDDMKFILGDNPATIGMTIDPVTLMPKPMQVPRYMAWAYVPPEELNRSYLFKPMGVFSLENKIVKAAQVMDLIKLNIGNPMFDAAAANKYVAVTLQGIKEAEDWWKPLPMMPGMGMLPPPPGNPGKKETPGMKGGPNGNQPSFLPPNPLRREPVVQ